jgi:predicted ATPase
VVGPGGVGKTRLAQHVGAMLRGRWASGPWWVDLTSLSSPALVGAAVARVLRIAHAPHRDVADAVASALRTTPTLLILDNAEHVLEGVEALVSVVIDRAPGAKVLITSQEPLGLARGQVLRLNPLNLPVDDRYDSARDCGAVTLFEARAQRLLPLFELTPENHVAVVDICRQLDGIPLAIELAAARLPLLGLDELRARLGARLKFLGSGVQPRLPRHQTLRATLDWSHGLLDSQEQRLFRHCGIFAGGFTLAAAQQLARDADLDDWGVLTKLGALVDKSIVVSECHAQTRFRLLESARLYAMEHLTAEGEYELVRERHARVMNCLLQVPSDDHRMWRTPPPAVPVLCDELDNVRAALDWASHSPDDELVIELAAGASHVFLAASLNAEYLQRVLPLRPRAAAPRLPPSKRGLFWARIALAASRNAHPAGLDAGFRAAAVYRDLGDAGRLYDALTWTLAIASRHGHGTEMQALIEEAERLEDSSWPPAMRSSWQWAKHRWLQSQGRASEALAAAHAQADLLQQAGHWACHVARGANVTDCEMSLGHFGQAEETAREALEALDAVGCDDNLVGHVLDALMVVLTMKGQAAEALSVARRALRLLQREGDEMRMLDSLALNAVTMGRWEEAARIAGHAECAMGRTGERRWPAAAERRQRLEQALAAALPPHAIASYSAEGAALSRDRIFEIALDAG